MKYKKSSQNYALIYNTSKTSLCLPRTAYPSLTTKTGKFEKFEYAL